MASTLRSPLMERGHTDIARPLMKVALAVLVLVVVGAAMAYLIAALTQVGPAARYHPFRLEGGADLFGAAAALLFTLAFIFPTNVIMVLALGIVLTVPYMLLAMTRET